MTAALNTGLVVDAIGDGLLDGLFGDDGTIDRLIEALDTGLVVPAETGLQGRLEALQAAGMIQWRGGRLTAAKPVARLRGKQQVSDLVAEMRE